MHSKPQGRLKENFPYSTLHPTPSHHPPLALPLPLHPPWQTLHYRPSVPSLLLLSLLLLNLRQLGLLRLLQNLTLLYLLHLPGGHHASVINQLRRDGVAAVLLPELG